MSGSYWIGVDLGGTKILTGLFDESLQLVARAKTPTEAEGGPSGVFTRIGQAVDSILREANVDAAHVKGMGFGIPGQIEPHTTTVRFAPNLNWRNLDVKPHLPESWKWPVVLDNDVRMGTYGEFSHGAAKGAKHVFGIFVGTGVGGGLIFNGELHHGFNGHGGEVGHIVVHWRKGTTLESVAGRRYQMRRAKEMLDDAPKRTRKDWKGVDLEKVKSSQLADFYQRHDPIAMQLIDDAARALGAGIASVVNLLSPEVVVIGGGVTQALGDSFIERIWELAQKSILPDAARGMKCVPAALGDDSGIIGCAAYAKSKLGGN
ncbi:ROK family protein [Limnoglobus roseus]|uniref:ROK family protein n=1 Tax=Limnoglobus roseus TaxID=2598579 RepID=A0A5C1AKG4_9BACT|nr:ROK family protein [Limnoglobus roseus]QEL19390.1 ROK family protein [Limnoglobus roseus]